MGSAIVSIVIILSALLLVIICVHGSRLSRMEEPQRFYKQNKSSIPKTCECHICNPGSITCPCEECNPFGKRLVNYIMRDDGYQEESKKE